jgi:hypothetical protein
MGEENATADTVDVSRLQNVAITMMLVLSFFYLLVEMMSDIKMGTMLSGSKDNPVFTTLPVLGASFTWLLAGSHATYLVAKAHDDPNGRATQSEGGKQEG